MPYIQYFSQQKYRIHLVHKLGFTLILISEIYIIYSVFYLFFISILLTWISVSYSSSLRFLVVPPNEKSSQRKRFADVEANKRHATRYQFVIPKDNFKSVSISRSIARRWLRLPKDNILKGTSSILARGKTSFPHTVSSFPDRTRVCLTCCILLK